MDHQTDICLDNASEPALSAAAALMHPDDVISDLHLTHEQKREILASWASDARAVHDMPSLRQLDNGAIVRVDDILRTLSVLDDDAKSGQRALPRMRPIAQRRRGRPLAWQNIAARRRPEDDDDDPPPCPAIIAGPPRSPLSDGEVVNPVLAIAA